MLVSDRLPMMKGAIELAVYDAYSGNFAWGTGPFPMPNVVTKDGRSWVLEVLESSDAKTSQSWGFIALGTDVTAPVSSDTALGSEVERKAVGTWDKTGITADPPYIQIYTTFATDEANTTLGELGLFVESSGGTMFSHATFGTKDKTTSNTAGVTYTISN